MSTAVYHIDQNVIIVAEENNQALQLPNRTVEYQQERKINKEKLKVILQISGCKPSHCQSLSDKIFDHIFSKLLGKLLKQQFQITKETYDRHKKSGNELDDQENIKYQKQNREQLTSPSKKYNSVLVSESYFKNIVINSVLEKEYMKDRKENYMGDFTIAWSLTERRDPLIILLGGTSGTGKSTVSSILAAKFGISTMLSTDSIRHIIRNFVSKEENAILYASTYEAGKYLQTDEVLSDTSRTIKGYKQQCKIVQEKLETVIQRFHDTNDTIIIEGVHLTPLFMLQVMKKYKKVLPFALCITKESKHKERFAVRSKYMTLNPENNKYIENFPKIRLIQKWFLEKADEYLIPKVDNSNIDKSIELIHKTIIAYLKKLQQPQVPEVEGLENQHNEKIIFSELKNALPFYEEYNKVNKSLWTSKELKDYINCQVNKNEIYENFLQQMNETQNQVTQTQMNKTEVSEDPIQLVESSNQLTTKGKVSQKELLQQSVQKFHEINQKSEKAYLQDQPNSTTKTSEGNFIVEGETITGAEFHHLSDDEDQNRRQFKEEVQTIKKVRSLKQLPVDETSSPTKRESPEKEQNQSPKGVSIDKQKDEEVKNFQEEPKVPQRKKVSFIQDTLYSHQESTQEIIKSKSEEEESTPQKIDYKGILQHLSKHKRLFLSKKTKPKSLLFIKKMIENYNENYKTYETNYKLFSLLIQNADGSYCLFKINQVETKIKKEKKQESEPENPNLNLSSSEQEESECPSSLNPGKSLLTPNFPFSEKRDISDGDDSVRFQPDPESDGELFEGGDEHNDSVEATDSDDDEDNINKIKGIDDEEDSFELQKIIEEDENEDEIK